MDGPAKVGAEAGENGDAERPRPPRLLPSLAAMRVATQAARIKFGVGRRRGGRLPFFMFYDACCIGILFAALTYRVRFPSPPAHPLSQDVRDLPCRAHARTTPARA